jgi:WW domain
MEKKKNAEGCLAKSSENSQGVKSLSRNRTKSGKLEPVEEPPDLPPLPPEWKAYKSKNRPDKLYYFNEKTGETSWQRPNSAREDSQRQTPGSSKTALSTPAQRKRVQKLVKIAKRSPEKLKKQTKPEVAIVYEVRDITY